jgi:hypothetical protein
MHIHQRHFKNRPRVDGAKTELNDNSGSGDPPSLTFQIFIYHIYYFLLAF